MFYFLNSRHAALSSVPGRHLRTTVTRIRPGPIPAAAPARAFRIRKQDVEPDIGSKNPNQAPQAQAQGHIVAGQERPVHFASKTAPLTGPCGQPERSASQSRNLQAGSDSQTKPLHHFRLGVYTSCRAKLNKYTAECWAAGPIVSTTRKWSSGWQTM